MNTKVDARSLMLAGGIGIIPMDTVYSVVARAQDPKAVTRLYALKRREGKPGTLVAATVEQLVELGFKRRYVRAVERFWPGPISVVIPCAELAYLHEGVGSLAVRIPAKASLLELLRATGPLMTSSANQPGQPPANTVEEARKYFGNDVDFYDDEGDMSGALPSTVIRVVDDAIEVLRQGAIQIDEQTGELLR